MCTAWAPRCLDASGAALAAGLAAAPDIIKPNRAELAELLGHALTDTTSVVAAARELLARPNAPGTVVVSMGGEGALFVTRQDALLAHHSHRTHQHGWRGRCDGGRQDRGGANRRAGLAH